MRECIKKSPEVPEALDCFEERVKIMVKQRLLENIKNFGYTPPKDPEQLLYDFYFIVGYLQGDRVDDPVLDFVFKEATQTCVANLRKHMLEALRWSLAAEFRNLFGDYASIAIDELPKDLLKFFKLYLTKYTGYNDTTLQKLQPERLPSKKAKSLYFQDTSLGKTRDTFSSSRDESYAGSYFALEWTQKRLKLSDSELANILQQAFTNDAIEWSPSYGGESWGKIANAYKKLLEADTLAKQIAYIDHAYDLQHNTGSVFSKVKAYSKNRGSLSWLAKALDWKKKQTDLRGFYSRVSGTLRPVVAWVAKNEAKVGTLEDMTKPAVLEPLRSDEPITFKEGKLYCYTGPRRKEWLMQYSSLIEGYAEKLLSLGKVFRCAAVDDNRATLESQDGGRQVLLPSQLYLERIVYPYVVFYEADTEIFGKLPPETSFDERSPLGWGPGDMLKIVSTVRNMNIPAELQALGPGPYKVVYACVYPDTPAGTILLRLEGMDPGVPLIRVPEGILEKISTKELSGAGRPKPNDEPFKPGHWYKWIGPPLGPGFSTEVGVYYNESMRKVLEGRAVKCVEHPDVRYPGRARLEGIGTWHWYDPKTMENPEVPLFAEVPPPR